MVGVGVAVEKAVAAVVVGIAAMAGMIVAGVAVVRVILTLSVALGIPVPGHAVVVGIAAVTGVVVANVPVVMAGMVVVMALARMAAVTGLGVRIACHFVPVATSGRPQATL
jgi:hypothetical protein